LKGSDIRGGKTEKEPSEEIGNNVKRRQGSGFRKKGGAQGDGCRLELGTEEKKMRSLIGTSVVGEGKEAEKKKGVLKKWGRPRRRVGLRGGRKSQRGSISFTIKIVRS